jgi:hypothetical protein
MGLREVAQLFYYHISKVAEHIALVCCEFAREATHEGPANVVLLDLLFPPMKLSMADTLYIPPPPPPFPPNGAAPLF